MYRTDRVLDALHKIKWELDGSVSFRRSCAHGICGSDAMRINGRNRLACKTLLRIWTLPSPLSLSRLRVFLREGPDCRYGAFLPGVPRDHAPSSSMTRMNRNVSVCSLRKNVPDLDDTTKCILCAACTSSCPVFWTDGQYFGPSAIVNAHRFIFDSRDDAGDLRLEILNDKEGVWRCRTTFNCTEACPRGIQITKAIAEVKQASFGASPLSLAVGELVETQDMWCGRKVGAHTTFCLRY